MTELSKINFKANFIAKILDEKWDHYLWSIEVNNQRFEYKTGLGHAVPVNGKNGRNKKPDEPCLTIDFEWIKIPQPKQVLYCLVSDAEAGEKSFNDFCSDFGYDNDSISALDVYRSCMETSDKLRKVLGSSFSKISEEVADA